MIFNKFTELGIHHHNPVLEYLYPSNKIPHSCLQLIPVPTPRPRQPLFYFLSLEICLSGYFIYTKLYNMWPFKSGFFYLA